MVNLFGDPQQFLEIGKYAAVIIRVSRLVFLFPFTEASICRQIGEKGRKENVGRLTAQGKRKGTFVNLFQDLGELFLEIGKYEDKLLDELLNEHRRSLLFYECIYKWPNKAMARVEKVVRGATLMRLIRRTRLSTNCKRVASVCRSRFHGRRRLVATRANSYTNSPMNSTIDGDLIADGQRAIIEAS